MSVDKRAKAKPQQPCTGSLLDEFLASKGHPLHSDIQVVRKMLLAADPSIREEIKWNSVSFRNDCDFFATVNLRSTDTLQVILYAGVKRKSTAETGVRIADPRGLIQKWAAKDRCIVALGQGSALKANKAAFVDLVRAWIAVVHPKRDGVHHA